MTVDYLGDTNANRKGKVFSVRITDEDRTALEAKAKIAGALMPYSYERRSGSLGAFLVWAALQWKNKTAPLPGVDAAGVVVVPARRRRGTTTAKAKRKGKAKPKAKAWSRAMDALTLQAKAAVTQTANAAIQAAQAAAAGASTITGVRK